ncbi:MAG: rhodanese-related sulfurtransferase [Candidatus Pelagibacterales bacterium]
MKKKIYIYAFYRFKKLDNIESIKKILNEIVNNKVVLGSILISKEGVNGTISGTKNDLNLFIKHLKKVLRIRKLSLKISENQFLPFYRLKIKLKKEIVTLGKSLIYPEKLTGKNIHPKDWDKIVNDNSYFLIDTRNTYEIGIGSFKNSINPKTKSFREFPKFIKKAKIDKKQKIAMFCTGGIRCEKASSFLLQNGYKNVFQLDGGILNYLEFKRNKSRQTWTGECFVFDNRVSVNKKLMKGSYDQCYGCRRPITKEDQKSKYYKKGVSCPNCYYNRSIIQKHNSLTRQKQIDIAEMNNEFHSFKKISSKEL